MRSLLVLSFFFTTFLTGFAQTLPTSRSVDWTLAGLRDTTTSGFQLIDLQAFGLANDSTTPNDSALSAALASVAGSGAILIFPEGNFLFNNTIELPNDIIMRGQGADVTTLKLDLGGTGHGINIQGTAMNSDTTSITQAAVKDSSYILVSDTTGLSVGDWIQIIQVDSDLVTSSWALKTVGQIIRIEDIVNDKIVLASPLRMDYGLARVPYIRKVDPVQNVGIECLKIKRIDDTAPQQGSNIHFSYAVNCWVKGIESQYCTFSHIEGEYSSNLHISESYIHHAFDYGGGGRAYGVMLHFTTGECLVENNIFEYLRHSMIVQAGANGNVFSYNYSLDPYWSSTPNDAAGDIVMHGNYVYSNLAEQNICQNIIIDDSHGPNGPYNTFFRNSADSYGIFFSASNSPDQNFLGNDIPNTGFPYSLVNYTILGTGHFIYGNNNKGTIDPAGTSALPDSTYAYSQRPAFVPIAEWAAIGTPNTMGSASIPARDRYDSGSIFNNSCSAPTVNIGGNIGLKNGMLMYPNPVSSHLIIESERLIKRVKIINVQGQVMYSGADIESSLQLDTGNWAKGIYSIIVSFENHNSVVTRAVKIQ